MSSDIVGPGPAVEFDHVVKRYRLGAARASWRTAVPGRVGEDLRGPTHTAIDDLSFELEDGGSLGIIGHNGAGKSTLLKLVAGVARATDGRVAVRGPVAALIELGAGFHPDMTGRENVSFSAAVLGMRRRALRQRLDEIFAFADIDAFLDTPVKRYSSGMLARLGFAVAAHLDASVLVVDEVLAVGDAGFQRRCHAKIAAKRAEGSAILYVTHQLWTVPIVCDRAMLLAAGKVVAVGEPVEIANRYHHEMVDRAITDWDEGIFTRVELHRPSGGNDEWSLEIDLELSEPAPSGHILASIVGPGNLVLASTTTSDSIGFSRAGPWSIRCTLPPVPLLPGRVELYVSFFEHRDQPAVADHRRLLIEVDGTPRDLATFGLVDLRATWTAAGE